MKRNVSVVRLKFRCNTLIIGNIIKEMRGTHYTFSPKKVCHQTLGLDVCVTHMRIFLQLILQPTIALNTIQYNTGIDLLHFSKRR